MSTATLPFPATVRRPSGSSMNAGKTMHVHRIEETERFEGWKFFVNKVRPWWVDMLEDSGFRVCTIYPRDERTLKVTVRPDE